MDKYTNTQLCTLPKMSELRKALSESIGDDVKQQIALLFDDGTFIETSAYAKRGFSEFFATEKSNEFESVITGYGAVDGKLVFAFAEDASRIGGSIDERHAKKICDLYALAMSNGAPVVGIFNSNGADIFAGTSALAAYGRIMTAITRASGVIPQISIVAGKCIGTTAAMAAMFDITVKLEGAELYVTSPALTGAFGAQDSIVAFTGAINPSFEYVRSLVSFLPENASLGVCQSDCTDNLNRKLGDVDLSGDALTAISVIADNGIYYELSHDFAPAATTVFASVGGVKCGIVGTSRSVNDGKLDADAATKIAEFVNLCDSFSLPVVTLVDSAGLAIDEKNEDKFAPKLAGLAFAYASASCPKVTVIMGRAIGASFVLLGSKSLGADLVYSLDTAEIAALTADSGVAFAWDKYITEEKTREQLVEEWKMNVSSPVNAAASGEIDDIIDTNELRARICSALLMLSGKNTFAV